ncbi:MAG: FAD-dependent monooxygenase [Polyangiaceae bacterium]
MNEHEVVIAGGGPTGLMLAAELALGGVDVAVVESRQTQELIGTRARGLHARTLEVLDQRGVVERFLAAGTTHQVASFVHILDISDLPTRHNYGLALEQRAFERILGDWVSELPVHLLRGREVTGFSQGDHGVEVLLADGAHLGAQYLVGCDGGQSVIRKAANIDFPGWEPSISYLIAEGTPREEPPWGIQRAALGVNAIGKLDDGKRMGTVLIEPQVNTTSTPSTEELRERLIAVYGSDFGIHDVTWLSRFTDAARQAASYRAGRVLLAGDAAHVHSPVGGQGLNLGVQDAVNLGWKLARVVRGASPEALLDTYHAERHPIGAQVLKHTLAITALSRGDDRTNALRDSLAELFAMDEPRRRYGALMSGLDIQYDFGPGHPLLGRRMPDLDLMVEGKPTRVFAFLRTATPVLFSFDAARPCTDYTNRAQSVQATCRDRWVLPSIGEVTPPSAVLVRPDGHVAWVGEGGDAGLEAALFRWCEAR